MQDETGRKSFEAAALPHLHELRRTALWLTHNYLDAEFLVRKALTKAYWLWHPSISQSNCRVLLFKVLTRLFFDGFQRKPAILSTKYKKEIVAGVLHDRLDLMHEKYAGASKRMIVRLPVEVEFVKFLSNLKGFSSEDIAEIIGLKLDSIETRSNRGFRLLQTEPFTYSGHD